MRSTACWSSDARTMSASDEPRRGWGNCVHVPDPCTTLPRRDRGQSPASPTRIWMTPIDSSRKSNDSPRAAGETVLGHQKSKRTKLLDPMLAAGMTKLSVSGSACRISWSATRIPFAVTITRCTGWAGGTNARTNNLTGRSRSSFPSTAKVILEAGPSDQLPQDSGGDHPKPRSFLLIGFPSVKEKLLPFFSTTTSWRMAASAPARSLTEEHRM